MKKQVIVSLSTVAVGIVLSACSDDVTKVTNEVSGMDVVASADSLGKCDAAALGKTVFASDENAAYVCADSGWVLLSKKQEDVVCVAEQLSDGSGYKIVCGGDSVGVVKNGSNGENGSDGKDGESGENGTSCTVENLSDGSGYKVLCGGDSVGVITNGATGENGADGSSCSLTDNGDGTVTQVCGADTITLYKAFCGDFAYDPEKAFCSEETVYSCGGKPYDPAEKFCVEGSVYDLCNGMTYDPMDTSWKCYGRKLIGQFTDSRDNQTYSAVKIGEQIWMAENLNYAYLEKTADLDSSSFCYDNSADSCAKYGRLYTWSAAMDSATVFSNDGNGCGDGTTCSATGNVRGVCPAGWHLPSNEEWNSLETFVANTLFDGNKDSVGYALKSASGWKDSDGKSGNGSDALGFGALPAGYRYGAGFNTFNFVLGNASFCSATETDTEFSYNRDMYYSRTGLITSDDGKGLARSVRCVKD